MPRANCKHFENRLSRISNLCYNNPKRAIGFLRRQSGCHSLNRRFSARVLPGAERAPLWRPDGCGPYAKLSFSMEMTYFMELTYGMQVPIVTSIADCYGRLRPSGLLSVMQELAGRHSASLGVGWNELTPRGLFWAVARQRVEFDRLPVIGETMTLETWPGPATRTAYPRYTVGRSESGEVLFRAAALWLIMDGESRAMLLPGKSGVEVPGLVRGDVLSVPCSLPPVVSGRNTARQVLYSELDVNGHMSNTKYLDWMEDLLPAPFHREHPLRGFQVSYLSEARGGESLDLQWDITPEGQLSLEARRQSEDKAGRVFAIRAQY